MLTPQFFEEMHTVLQPEGGLTIFSDNYKYCKLLARTIASLRAPADGDAPVGDRRFRSRRPSRFGGQSETVDGVELHHGVPDAEAGHAANVTSYFDRFWAHGHKTDRFFLFVTKA